MATNQLMIKKSQEKWESRKSRDYARSFSSRMLYYYSSSTFCFCFLATSYQSSYLSTTEIYFQMMIVMYISLIISFLIKDAKQNAKWAAIKSSRLDLSKACPQSFWPTTQKLAWGVSFDPLDPYPSEPILKINERYPAPWTLASYKHIFQSLAKDPATHQ